jgi:uncharacterized SAM-binding protein YcdF (DUF218 family)
MGADRSEPMSVVMLRESLRWSILGLALFGIVNLARGALTQADDNLWWIDLRWLPAPIAACVLGTCCIAILAGGALPHHRRARAGAAAGCLILALVATANAAVFWSLLVRGHVRSDIPVPLSAVLAAFLLAAAWAHTQPPCVSTPRRALAAIPALAVALAFPVLQIFSFGFTSYARPADAIVVFGARVYADGSPSDALSDRVREGIRLYHAGLAPRLVVSGGPGDGPTTEPEAMQRLAESLGVPGAAITQDPQGINSAATIETCRALRLQRVVAVSHFYHLPRIKLLAERAGVEVFTVPSPQGRALRALPVFVAREVAAWWWYYASA